MHKLLSRVLIWLLIFNIIISGMNIDVVLANVKLNHQSKQLSKDFKQFKTKSFNEMTQNEKLSKFKTKSDFIDENIKKEKSALGKVFWQENVGQFGLKDTKFLLQSQDTNVAFNADKIVFSINNKTSKKVDFNEMSDELASFIVIEGILTGNKQSSFTGIDFKKINKLKAISKNKKALENVKKKSSLLKKNDIEKKISAKLEEYKKFKEKNGKYSENLEMNLLVAGILEKNDWQSYSVSYEQGTFKNVFGYVEFLTGKQNLLVMSGGNKPIVKSVNAYSSLKIPNLYDGVDAIINITKDGLKSEYQLMPKISPSNIVIKYSGVDELSIDDKGNLIVKKGNKIILETAPVSYQIKEALVVPVDSKYKLLGNNKVGFEIGDYDPDCVLYIDPLVKEFMKPVDLKSDTNFLGIKTDGAGNSFVAYNTRKYVGNKGYNQFIVYKYNKAGDLDNLFALGSLDSSYNGSDFEVTKNGYVYIAGNYINSSNSYNDTVFLALTTDFLILNYLELYKGYNISENGVTSWASYRLQDLFLDSANNLYFLSIKAIGSTGEDGVMNETHRISINRYYQGPIKEVLGFDGSSRGNFMPPSMDFVNHSYELRIISADSYQNFSFIINENYNSPSKYYHKSSIYTVKSDLTYKLISSHNNSDGIKSCDYKAVQVDKSLNVFAILICVESNGIMSWKETSSLYKYTSSGGQIKYAGHDVYYTMDSCNNSGGGERISELTIDSLGNVYTIFTKDILNNTCENGNIIGSSIQEVRINKYNSKGVVEEVFKNVTNGYTNKNSSYSEYYYIDVLKVDNSNNLFVRYMANKSQYSNGNNVSSTENGFMKIDSVTKEQTKLVVPESNRRPFMMFGGYPYAFDVNGDFLYLSMIGNAILLSKISDTNKFKLKATSVDDLKFTFEQDEIVLEFNSNIDYKTRGNVKLIDESGASVKLGYASSANLLILKIQQTLKEGKYTLVVGKGLKDTRGYYLTSESRIVFYSNGPYPVRFPNDLEKQLSAMTKVSGELTYPINLRKGELKFSKTIDRYTNLVMPFDFTVSYSSTSTFNGPLGKGFFHSYMIYLQKVGFNKYILFNSDGSYEYFTQKNGIFYGENGTKKRLVQDAQTQKFSVHLGNGIKYDFDEKLLLEKIIDESNNFLKFEHDADGNMIKMIDTNQDIFTFNYNEEGRLIYLLKSNGAKIHFNYSKSGSINLLTSIKNDKDSTGLIGLTTSFVFVDSRLINAFDADNNKLFSVEYLDAKRIGKYFDGDGKTTTFNYTYFSGTMNPQTLIITDPKGIQTYLKYDIAGNLTQKILGYTQAGSRSYIYTYASSRVKTIRFPRGNGVLFKYDEDGNIIEKRTKTQVTAADNDLADSVELYTYEPLTGKIHKEYNSLGFGKQYEYSYFGGNLDNIAKRYGYSTNDLLLKMTYRGIINRPSLNWADVPKLKTIRVISNGGTTKYVLKEYAYNTDGTLQTNKSNNVNYQYLYDGKGRMISTINGNLVTNYMYDNRGNLSKTSMGININGGFQEVFASLNLYDAYGQLSVEKTAGGIAKRTTYTPGGRVLRSCYAKYNGGESTSIGSYICQNYTTEYFYTEGGKITGTSLYFTKDGNTSSLVSSYTYDNNGNLIIKSGGGESTKSYEYDNFNQVIKLNDSGWINTYRYDTNGNMIAAVDYRNSTISYKYNLFDKKERQTLPDGTYILYSYDKLGRELSQAKYSRAGVLLEKSEKSYDDYNLASESINNAADQTKRQQTTYEYTNGLLTKITNPLGGEKLYGYDGFGNVNYEKDVTSGVEMFRNYIAKDVLSESQVRNNGVIVSESKMEYDVDMRLIREMNYDKLAGDFTRNEYQYNDYGQVVGKVNTRGVKTDYEYGLLGKVVKETVNGKDLQGQVLYRSNRYNYDVYGNMISFVDGQGNATNLEFDMHNRVVKKSFADGSMVQHTYDDIAGKTTTILQDATKVEDYVDRLGDLDKRIVRYTNGKIESIDYQYDEAKRLIAAIDSKTDIRFEYDGYGDLTKEVQKIKAKGTSHAIGYNYENSLLKKQIYPTGKVVEFDYDKAGRLTDVYYNGVKELANTYNGGFLGSELVGNNFRSNFSYNGFGKLVGINYDNVASIGIDYDGLLFKSSKIFDEFKTTYTYDDFDQLIGTYYSINNDLYKNQRQYYDLAGNRKRYEQNETIGGVMTNSLDSYYESNNLNQYKSLNQTIIDSGTKQSATSIKSNDGAKVVQPESIKQLQVFSKLSDKKEDLKDNAAMLSGKNVESKLKKSDENFVISGSSGSKSLQEYKALEITPSKSINQTINLQYDKLGNLTFDGKNYYKYDYKNRLVSINGEEIIYDALGRRLAKGGTVYVVNILDQVLEEKGANTKIFVNGIEQDDLILMQINSGNKQYFHQDEQGSVVMITNENKGIVRKYYYDSVGNVFEKNSSGNLQKVIYTSSIENPYFWQGKRWEGDLYYWQARYYSPSLGRFVSQDPQGIVDSMNLYLFVKNNPSSYVDPSGEEIDSSGDEKLLEDIYKYGGGDVTVYAINKGGKQLVEDGLKTTPYWVNQIVEGSVKGDYINEPNGWNILGQILGGFTPGGIVGDIRDLSYQWKLRSPSGIVFAGIGFVPGIGDGAKGLYKRFDSIENALEHFEKHINEINYILNKKGIHITNLEEYIDKANDVIKNGEYFETFNSYIQHIIDDKYLFVGVSKNYEYITTFHVKSLNKLYKKLESRLK